MLSLLSRGEVKKFSARPLDVLKGCDYIEEEEVDVEEVKRPTRP